MPEIFHLSSGNQRMISEILNQEYNALFRNQMVNFRRTRKRNKVINFENLWRSVECSEPKF